MNSYERMIYDKYAYSKPHVFLVYEEFERRVNSTLDNYEGLKNGECRFDYKSWENRLNITRKKLQTSIKYLSNDNVIKQVTQGKKGYGGSVYFLSRFEDNKKDNNMDNNKDNNKISNTNGLKHDEDKKKDNNTDKKKDNTSIYNNLNIISNNIYSSSEENELIKKINSKYSKELIKEEFNKVKLKGFIGLELLKELDKNLKSKNSNKVKKDKYTEDSKEYKLSILLRDLILERDSNSRCRNANMQSWGKYIDLLHRKDNRSYEDIENIIKWSQQDNFWKSNILSTQKLREKFDTLYQKFNSGQASHKNGNSNKSNKSHNQSEDNEYDWYWENSLKIN